MASVGQLTSALLPPFAVAAVEAMWGKSVRSLILLPQNTYEYIHIGMYSYNVFLGIFCNVKYFYVMRKTKLTQILLEFALT